MKKIYEIPELTVNVFVTSDVMTASEFDNDVSWGDNWNSIKPDLGGI